MLKKFYSFLVLTFVSVTCILAQEKSSGIIAYDQVINLKAGVGQSAAGSISFSMGAAGGPSIPDKVTNRFELLFSPVGAKFQKALVDDAAAGGFRISVGSRDLFFQDDKAVESFELDGEPLLLSNKLGYGSSSIEKSDETKKIIGFDCKKAVITGANNAKTTIWYTTELPFKATPLVPFWTEGVVLGIENDRMQFAATNVQYTKVKDNEFALPKKAKLLTQEEYTKKMDEYRAKMGNGMVVGPDGSRRIIRTN